MSRRLAFVEELLARGVLPADRADAARAAAADEAHDLDAWLRAAECDASEVLLAACEVFALPAAPAAWLAAPLPLDVTNVDGDTLRALGAVPVHAGPPVRVAFASPLVATSKDAAALGEHRPYLATPDAVARALEIAPPRSPLPTSIGAPATTKVPKDLAVHMAGVFDAMARADDAAAHAGQASEEGGQRTERHMMAMPAPSSLPEAPHPTTSSHGTDAVAADAGRAASNGEIDVGPVRPAMLVTAPVVAVLAPHEVEAKLAEAQGLGGKTFGVRAIVKKASEQPAVAVVPLHTHEGTVQDLLNAMGPLPVLLATKIIGDVVDALVRAHEIGSVHRDMKPASLIVVDGKVTLDQRGFAPGAAEEAVTDLFSLGRLWFHLLAGKDPFATPQVSIPDVMEHVPTLPELVAQVLERLLVHDAKSRMQSAREVKDAIAPLVAVAEAHHPRLVADALADAAGTAKRLRAEQAAAELARARACMRTNRKREAAYALRRSIELDAADLRAQQLLRKVCATEKLTFVTPEHADVEAAKKSDDAAVLVRAADACLEQGAIEQASLFLRRALLRHAPEDRAAVQAKLADIVGDATRAEGALLPFAHVAPAGAAAHAAATHDDDDDAAAGVLRGRVGAVRAAALVVVAAVVILAVWAATSS